MRMEEGKREVEEEEEEEWALTQIIESATREGQREGGKRLKGRRSKDHAHMTSTVGG